MLGRDLFECVCVCVRISYLAGVAGVNAYALKCKVVFISQMDFIPFEQQKKIIVQCFCECQCKSD